MKYFFTRCFLMLVCLAMSLGVCSSARAGGYDQVIPPQYDDVKNFSEGFAAVMVGDNTTGKWGFIDKTGKVVVSPKYDAAYSFRDGMALVRVGDYETGKWGFVDKTGKEVVSPKYDAAANFRDGMALVRVGDYETGKWGFVDQTGQEVVAPKYDWAGAFHDGLAMVCVGDRETEAGKWGFIDKTGKEVVPTIYDDVGEFREERAAVIMDGKLGFVDETGAIVIPMVYSQGNPSFTYLSFFRDTVPYFSEGLAAVWDGDEQNGQFGYIDKEGKVIIPFEYDYAGPFSEGLAYVNRGGTIFYEDDGNGKFGYIDKNGEVVVPLVYDCDYPDHEIIGDWIFSGGLAHVSIKDGTSLWGMKYGMVDKTGKIIVPIQYDFLWSFYGGLAFAGYGGDHFGRAFVFEGGSAGLVDETGKEVVAVGEYDYIGVPNMYFLLGRYRDLEGTEDSRFRMGRHKDIDENMEIEFILVGSRDEDSEIMMYGFVDNKGNVVVPCTFEDARVFSEDFAAVSVDGKWGYIAITK